MIPTALCAVMAVCGYFAGVAPYREDLVAFAEEKFGQPMGDITPILLILPAFLIFLIPILTAAALIDRFKLICPSCERDVSGRFEQLLATRCCPFCDQQIVTKGHTRSATAYKRLITIRQQLFFRKWLWAWPFFGLLAIAWRLIDPSVFQQCPQALFMAPLIGTTAAAWAWIRVSRRLYSPQLLVSIAVLCIGAVFFWNSL